ncbi:MAG: helix-turn-helix domain-containing protein [Oscillospiraceae bacterium]|jgi:transcriptional regulator with XRE-family HTH domain
MVRKHTNDILRSLREANDRSQAEIAHILGVSQQTYSNYENGVYDLPSRHLPTLCKYYQVTADYLLGLTRYRGSLQELNRCLNTETTLGALIGDILSLNEKSQSTLMECVELLKIRQSMK